jgi:hypothetical protein
MKAKTMAKGSMGWKKAAVRNIVAESENRSDMSNSGPNRIL